MTIDPFAGLLALWSTLCLGMSIASFVYERKPIWIVLSAMNFLAVVLDFASLPP